MKTKKDKLQIWECALLIALCVTLCSGLWANARQNRLSGELVRLHVVAESDSPEDQAVKLEVRDAVLNFLSPKLKDVKNVQEAQSVISDSLPELTNLAGAVTFARGKDCSVSARVNSERFPTRDYDGFSLPAGDYVSLRVSLGEAQGKNWWCVVFPPLCMAAVEEGADAFGQLSEESREIIRTEDGQYNLKFHIIEIFEKIKQIF